MCHCIIPRTNSRVSKHHAFRHQEKYSNIVEIVVAVDLVHFKLCFLENENNTKIFKIVILSCDIYGKQLIWGTTCSKYARLKGLCISVFSAQDLKT